MSFLYLAGLSDNLITSATLSSSSADSNFPLANLKSDYVWRMFRFNAAALNDQITADLGSAQAVTFSSVHFHNIDSGVTAIQLRSSTDNFSASDDLEATFTKASPSFYATIGSTSRRYWRLRLAGTNGSAAYIGKWTLGVSSSLTEVQLQQWNLGYEREQVEPQPGIRVNQTTHARRLLRLPFINTTDSAKNEILAMLDDSAWGAEPIVAVPDSTESMVIYGRAEPSLEFTRSIGGSDNGLYEHTLQIAEDRFPVIVT